MESFVFCFFFLFFTLIYGCAAGVFTGFNLTLGGGGAGGAVIIVVCLFCYSTLAFQDDANLPV